MRNIICLGLFIISVLTSTAQIKAVDSLKLLLAREKTDTGRIQKLIYIGLAYGWRNNDTAFIYFRDALNQSEQIGYIPGEIRTRSSMANILFYIKADYASALELYLYNLNVEEQTGDTLIIFYDIRDVCLIYAQIEDHEKQFEYTKKLRDLAYSGFIKDSVTLSDFKSIADTRLGAVYEKLNQLDSAKYYRLRAYHDSSARKDWARKAWASIGLGKIYAIQKKYDSAFYYVRAGIAIASQRNRRHDVYRDGLIAISSLHWKMKHIDSAFYYAEKAFKLSEQTMSRVQMMRAAELLAEIYYAKKRPDSAYKYLSFSMLLKDSIFNSEKMVKMQNLGFQKSLQKQQQEQAKKEAVQEYKSKIKIYSLVAGVAALLIFILILYRNNRQRQTANKKIEKAYIDLKSTQAQLIQSEKMASLGELTAGIAHEIQNPLNFVNNFSDVNTELVNEAELEMDNGNLSEARTILSDIKENERKINHHGKRADSIVKGMLQHSRTSSGQKEPTDINLLADEYLRLSYHGLRAQDKSFNANFNTHFDNRIGKLSIIPQDIGRVILNLINNAFYAVSEKQKHASSSSALNGYEPTVSLNTKKTNGKVEIKVSDNGNGIPQKVLDKIFQPFFTTKPAGQGTGLGLSMSYDIVKAHGGELKVNTKENEGTQFTITLPV